MSKSVVPMLYPKIKTHCVIAEMRRQQMIRLGKEKIFSMEEVNRLREEFHSMYDEDIEEYLEYYDYSYDIHPGWKIVGVVEPEQVIHATPVIDVLALLAKACDGDYAGPTVTYWLEGRCTLHKFIFNEGVLQWGIQDVSGLPWKTVEYEASGPPVCEHCGKKYPPQCGCYD